jgi:WD40 repeat protein
MRITRNSVSSWCRQVSIYTLMTSLGAAAVSVLPVRTVDLIGRAESADAKAVATKMVELPQRYSDVWSRGLAFSPDGAQLAVRADGQKIDIWDWRTRRMITTVERPEGATDVGVSDPLSFSPDGRFLAACFSRVSGLVARIWAVDGWRVVKDISKEGQGTCTGMTFTLDGSLLLWADDSSNPPSALAAIKVGTWEQVWTITLRGHPASLCVSPDGAAAIVSGVEFALDPQRRRTTLFVADIGRQTVLKEIPTDTVGPVACSSDSQRVAIAGPDATEIRDIKSGEKLSFDREQPGNKNARFSRDGQYFIESDMNGRGTGLGVQIWDASRQRLLQKMSGNPESLAVSRDGKYLAVGDVGHTTIWRLK